jgi:hypothetical protein
MIENYGTQMTTAIKAVLQMHSDASKLLLDLDKTMQGYQTLFGSIATINLSWDVKTGKYMADGLFRHYVRKDDETQVRAVNICFFDVNDLSFEEPILVAAHISYFSVAKNMPEKSKRAWDPWTAFASWNQEKVFNKRIVLDGPLKGGAIQSVILTATPLFSIHNQETVKALINAVAPEEQMLA